MASKYPGIQFIKVDVDQLASVAKRFGVTAMPTFKFFQSSKILDEIVGADVGKIERLLLKYSKEGSSGNAFSGSGNVLGSGAPVKGSPTTNTNGVFDTTNTLFLVAVGFLVYKYFTS